MKWYSPYSMFVGALYILYGIIEVIDGAITWWTPMEINVQLGIPFYGTYLPRAVSDPFFGFVMLVIGSIFVLGGRVLAERLDEGWAFVTMALLLSGAVAVLSILIVGANWLDSSYPSLWGEQVEWSILDDGWALNPGLVLFPLALPLLKVYRLRT